MNQSVEIIPIFPAIMSGMDALLLEMGDGRKYATEVKNLQLLTAFCKTFKVEMSVVKFKQKQHLIDLEVLAALISSGGSQDISEYEVVDKKISKDLVIPPLPSSKEEVLVVVNADQIKEYIKTKMLSKHSVSIKELIRKFNTECGCDYSGAYYSALFSKARNELMNSGHPITKIGQGEYCILFGS